MLKKHQFIVALSDKNYPPLLKKIKRPPKVLYGKGSVDVLRDPSLAMVGTRKASGEGREFARRVAYELVQAGLCVVSGLAQGIDGAAHEGALDAKGKTIGVLGSSLEEQFFFPHQHRKLARDMIEQGGAIISEYEKNQPALRGNFVARNRIVAGISLGVLVVEAPRKSGALITAEFARKEKRLVFAVPGSPFSRNFEGTNFLIKTGAFLVQNANDILDVLARKKLFLPDRTISTGVKNIRQGEMGGEEHRILEVLSKGQVNIDKLAQITKVEVPKLLSMLIELELKGVVKNVGGGNYVVVK